MISLRTYINFAVPLVAIVGASILAFSPVTKQGSMTRDVQGTLFDKREFRPKSFCGCPKYYLDYTVDGKVLTKQVSKQTWKLAPMGETSIIQTNPIKYKRDVILLNEVKFMAIVIMAMVWMLGFTMFHDENRLYGNDNGMMY